MPIPCWQRGAIVEWAVLRAARVKITIKCIFNLQVCVIFVVLHTYKIYKRYHGPRFAYPYYLRRLTYLLTPWSRVLLEKLTGFAASQEIPRIYGTRKFISVPTSARHLSLS
jgi:hypothetical protein